MEFAEELRCPVCQDLLAHPVILSCGHNVCHICLAKTFLASNRRNCPTCQHPWTGRPTINTALSDMITRSHRDLLLFRTLRLFTEENMNTLKAFDEEMQKAEAASAKQKKIDTLWSGIDIAVIILVAVYVLYYWFGPSADRRQEPVVTWRSSDVAHWLDTLTCAHEYTPLVQDLGIDGRALMGMDELDLVRLLNVTDTMHQSAMQLAIRSIRETGVKVPETVWEYKALYPGRTLFLQCGLLSAPRSTVLFLYLFYYEESFLPFLHYTTPVEHVPATQWGKLPDPTLKQWISFGLFTLILPYWNMLVFAWSLQLPYVILASLVVTLGLMTFYDIRFFVDFVWLAKWRNWKLTLQPYVPKVKVFVGLLCLWPVLPTFFLDFIFYTGLFVFPSLVLLGVAVYIVQRMRANNEAGRRFY